MFPNRRSGGDGAGFIRTRVRPVVRRGVAHIGPLDRAASRVVQQRRALGRLLAMYETLRRTFAGRVSAAEVPSDGQIDRVEAEVLKGKIFGDFFEALITDGDFDRAAVATTRSLIGARETGRARCIAQTFQQYDVLRPIADICLAICAFVEPMPETAWKLFARNDLDLIMRWAAHEYFLTGFRLDPDTAAASLRRVLDGDIAFAADPDIWLLIAYHSFAAGYLDLAERTLKRAEAAMAPITDPNRVGRLNARLSALKDWLGRAARAARPVEAPEGEIPFALIGFQHPDWRFMTTDLADPTETLAALGHLLRHDGVEFSGDEGLVAAARELRADVPSGRRIGGQRSKVRLYEVDRDVSQYAAVPDGTWTIMTEWFTQPLGGTRYDMPLNPKLRPIFVSFHITPAQLAGPGVIEYLRQYAPIGCRDKDTAFLLHAAGVPAFFAGAITATIDNVVPRASSAAGAAKTIFIDTEPNGPGERRSRHMPHMRDRKLGENLSSAASTLRGYRDANARVVTSDLRTYLAARAVGCTAEFRPAEAADYRVIDFVDLGDGELESMQRGVSDKLNAVLGAILAGHSETQVYDTWRDVCAADIAAIEAELGDVAADPKLTFDLGEICRAIRAAAVTLERTEPGPDGAEINIEFSLDENYKHQFDIVLDSVVEHASRPIRAFVLCRGHGQEDYDRMARLFPTVSFVWLPTDAVDFGRIIGMNRWVTAATMDRTIMPVLLEEVDRIIHFDLDAMSLSDIAELFDVDFEGTALAAAPEPQPRYVGGYDTIRRTARRIRREGNPQLAHEFMVRMHARHPFDFDIFNAGIMVMNLAKLREDDFCGRYLPYLQTYGVNGQTVICVYVGRDFKVIDAQWNRLMRLELAETPKIAHWAGPYKPWRPHHFVAGRALWRAQELRFASRTERLWPVSAAVA